MSSFQDSLKYILICDSKLIMFGLRTKQDIYGHHRGFLELPMNIF